MHSLVSAMTNEYIHDVLTWGQYMGVIPFYNERRSFKTNKTRSKIVIAIIVTGYFLSIIGKICWHDRKVLDLILLQILSLTIFTCNIRTIYIFNIGDRIQNLQQLVDLLDSVDSTLLSCNGVRIPTIKSVHSKISSIFVFTFLLCLLDYILWNFNDGVLNPFWFFDYVQNFYILYSFMLEIVLLIAITNRFQLYNFVIDDLYKKQTIVESYVRADQFIRLHHDICDLIDLFNSIFGLNMLAGIMYNLISVLVSLKIFINFEKANGYYLLCTYSIWIIYCVAQEISMAAMCEKLIDEGKKTVTLVYKALYKFNNITLLREKLFILAQQAQARSPEFSAGGFFTVNYAMLFTFVNLIATYVIVIVQFSGDKKA